MVECAQDLNISRKTVKEYLNTGKSYKGILFFLSSSLAGPHNPLLPR